MDCLVNMHLHLLVDKQTLRFPFVYACVYDGGGSLILTEWKEVAGGESERDRRWRGWVRVSVCVGMQVCPVAVTLR